ncbi:hypothetical protein AN958_09385 [Leucoagaricus sp. SymC.cos]|nr:hypothetical protein AN958_09385 [Leucoagaricus sp. SymC.cos]
MRFLFLPLYPSILQPVSPPIVMSFTERAVLTPARIPALTPNIQTQFFTKSTSKTKAGHFRRIQPDSPGVIQPLSMIPWRYLCSRQICCGFYAQLQ